MPPRVSKKTIAEMDLNEFKAHVAKVAIAKAKYHGWCPIVTDILRDDLGLAEFLPPRYRVDVQRMGQDWTNARRGTFDDKNEALYEIKEYVRSRRRNRTPAATTATLNITIEKGKSLKDTVKEIQDRAEETKKALDAGIVYPQYRLVEIKNDKEEVVVTDDQVVEMVKPKPRKKAVATAR